MQKIYKLKLYMYNILINKHPGIRQRYQKYHEGVGKGKKITLWIYFIS